MHSCLPAPRLHALHDWPTCLDGARCPTPGLCHDVLHDALHDELHDALHRPRARATLTRANHWCTTIVGYDFKRLRVEKLHRHTLRPISALRVRASHSGLRQKSVRRRRRGSRTVCVISSFSANLTPIPTAHAVPRVERSLPRCRSPSLRSFLTHSRALPRASARHTLPASTLSPRPSLHRLSRALPRATLVHERPRPRLNDARPPRLRKSPARHDAPPPAHPHPRWLPVRASASVLGALLS
jgi:hypothetical protein